MFGRALVTVFVSPVVWLLGNRAAGLTTPWCGPRRIAGRWRSATAGAPLGKQKLVTILRQAGREGSLRQTALELAEHADPARFEGPRSPLGGLFSMVAIDRGAAAVPATPGREIGINLATSVVF